MREFKKIITLDNEFEAKLMEQVLIEKEIPFLIQSYHSIAYGGIFQVSKGWGHLESDPKHEEEIISIYNDLKNKDGIVWE